MLVPLPFLDKVLGVIAENSSTKELEGLKVIAVKLLRRAWWEELTLINKDKTDYETIKVPLTRKELNWLKEKYDMPI